MSSKDDSWAKRRRRLTKCKKHGLHFDSELTSGCALCRKEGLIVGPKRTGPQFLMLLLVLLGLALLAASLVNNLREGRGSQEEEAETVANSTRLDPNPFRTQIEDLDRVLGETPSADLSFFGLEIRTAALALAAKMARSEEEGARQVGRTLADWAEDIPEERFSAGDLSEARATWSRIAGRRFKSASWRSTPTTKVGDDHKITLVAYREASEQLLALADEGAAQVVAFGDTTSFGDGEDWPTFAADWRQRISDVGQSLPSQREFGGDATFLAAVQDLRGALSLLDRLAADRNLPAKSNASARLEEATEKAESARAAFDSLTAG